MKEFVISEAKVEIAVLVGLITQTQDERKTNEYLDELAFLAETAGAEVVKRFTQKLPTANSVTYVGKGKLEEISFPSSKSPQAPTNQCDYRKQYKIFPTHSFSSSFLFCAFTNRQTAPSIIITIPV